MPCPLLITRPKDQAEQFAAQVAEKCPEKFLPVISPLLEIRPEPCSVDTDGAQALLFSSRNAVREFARRSNERNLPALCVGEATAREASEMGFSSMSADGDATALAALAVQSYLPDFGYMLHFRGAESAGDIAGSLMSEGVPAEDRIIYDQFPLYLTQEAIAQIDGKEAIAVVFSPRSASLLADELSAIDTRKITFVAISSNTAEPIRRLKVQKIYVSKVPNSQAILEALQLI